MTTPREPQRFAPQGQGPLALEPQAFGFLFSVSEPERLEPREDGTAIVNIRGPLMHHAGWFDSYDAIKSRVAEALEAGARAIVLNIDSPGGLVHGCFDTAAAIREMADARGVKLYAYVDGQCTSAAYAIACMADHIAVPSTGCVGSIGIIDALMDGTRMDAQMGLQFAIIASGARKFDGNPHVPITDGARAAKQISVNALAETFFAHVATARGISVDELRAMQAAVVTGAAAVPALADEVQTLDELLAAIASGTVGGDDAALAAGETTMSKAYEDAIAALRKCASGEGDEAKKAKKMLAAELAEDDAPADPPEEEDTEEDPPAEGKDKGGDAEARAMAKTALDKANALEAGEKKRTEDARAAAVEAERTTLLASRPDLPTELVAVLRAPTASIESVREIVKTHPRGKVPNPAAAAAAIGTRGEGQGEQVTTSPETQALDEAFGLAKPRAGVRKEGLAMVFSALDAEREEKTQR